MNITVKVASAIAALSLLVSAASAPHPLSDAALKDWFRANAEYNGLLSQLMQSLTPQQKQIQQQMESAATKKDAAKRKLAEECAGFKSVLTNGDSLDPTCPVVEPTPVPESK